MRGRKPKPTRLKLIEGNPGKRRIASGEPQPSMAVPIRPPPFLQGYALEEWDRVVGELARMGVMTGIDTAVLAAYAQAFGRWRFAEEKMAEMAERDATGAGALIIRTALGNHIQNPMLSIARKALADMARYAAEFGMTPAARVRLANAGGNPLAEGSAADPLARLMVVSSQKKRA
jgi:P27 family predicted phage terminase small subunit